MMERQSTLKEDKMFLSIRDNVNTLINKAGCVTLEKAIAGHSGDTREMISCVDRLVALGEIKKIERSKNVCGYQYEIYIKSR